MNNLKYIDLCAGTGCFSYVLQNYGAECVLANDYDKNSKKIYETNFPNHNFIYDDLNNINNDDIPEFDIVCVGFSCQPFSIAGNRRGFEDERSSVLIKTLDIIKDKNPKIAIFENVKNFLTHDNGNSLKFLLDKLKDMNYYVKYKLLDTSKLTEIPQHRERVYFIAFKEKVKFDKFNFDFEIKEKKNINEFLENNIQDKYYYTENSNIYNKLLDTNMDNINTNKVYQYRRTFVRENKNNCVPTLTANMGTGGHNVPIIKNNNGIRKLTPRECFNFQGFPQNYILPSNMSDGVLYKLAGNAVTMKIVELIIHQLNQIYQNNQ